MKKNFTLILIVLAFFAGSVNAQNLIELWDGDGATGTGTGANVFGWINPTVTAWADANATGGVRYIDNPANYTYKGNPWTGRVLFTRWDGSAGAALTSIWAYPIPVTANKTYMFTGRFNWHNNASSCFFKIGINTNSDNSGNMLAYSTISITDVANKMKLYDDTMVFSPSADGTIYFTLGNTSAVLGPVCDLSVVEVTDATLVNYAQQKNSLTLGDLSAVTTDIALPTGSNGVSISWSSSNPSVLSNTGTVTRPSKFDVPVILTATISVNYNGQIIKETKIFTATVVALTPATELIAQWDFSTASITLENDTIKIADISGSNLVGNLANEASVRSIGTTTKFNVLDLGNSKGYFNMGKEIGKAIYSLSNYTICGYFRVDTSYKELNSNGNFLWTFSNSADQPTDKNGYIIGSLKATGQSISSNYYDNGNQAVQVGTPAAQGAWHHMAYTQEGDSGKVYIDGVVVKRGLITNKPYNTLPKSGLEGTPFNWIGRSNYPSDVYLRQTLVYDFRLLSVPLSVDDMQDYLEVNTTLAALNAAYTESPSNPDPELQTEADNLSLGDLSAVTSNITLPTQGVQYTAVKIIWKSSFPALISNTGVVTRPDYLNRNVTLTATLFKDGKTIVKTFPATIVYNPANNFTSDLIARFDFAPSRVSGTAVTDSAEKHYVGTLMPGATIRSIGTTKTYNVLDLGSTTGYFDMGTEIGKAIYSLSEYTIGGFFLIDNSYAELGNNGNFLWSLSNTDKVLTDKNGYIFGSLKELGVSLAPTDYTTAQTVTLNTQATKDSRWHHLAYSQSATEAVLYVDGFPANVISAPALTLSNTLPKDGRLGTNFNWLGRSCYVGDVYLRQTLVSDFRIYKKALNPDEIENSEMKVTNTIAALNAAYIESTGTDAVSNISQKLPFFTKVVNNQIYILGLKGPEKVTIYDLTGRNVKVNNAVSTPLNSGLYIVKVDNKTQKVFVK